MSTENLNIASDLDLIRAKQLLQAHRDNLISYADFSQSNRAVLYTKGIIEQLEKNISEYEADKLPPKIEKTRIRNMADDRVDAMTTEDKKVWYRIHTEVVTEINERDYKTRAEYARAIAKAYPQTWEKYEESKK